MKLDWCLTKDTIGNFDSQSGLTVAFKFLKEITDNSPWQRYAVDLNVLYSY